MITEDELKDFDSILKKNGKSRDDYELKEESDPRPNTDIYPITGKLNIKNKETGQLGTYKTGHRTSWVVQFEEDLNKGLI